MRHITRKPEPFNSTDLWLAARKREFRALSYAERKLAQELGVEPAVAKLLAQQAYGGGGRR